MTLRSRQLGSRTFGNILSSEQRHLQVWPHSHLPAYCPGWLWATTPQVGFALAQVGGFVGNDVGECFAFDRLQQHWLWTRLPMWVGDLTMEEKISKLRRIFLPWRGKTTSLWPAFSQNDCLSTWLTWVLAPLARSGTWSSPSAPCWQPSSSCSSTRSCWGRAPTASPMSTDQSSSSVVVWNPSWHHWRAWRLALLLCFNQFGKCVRENNWRLDWTPHFLSLFSWE